MTKNISGKPPVEKKPLSSESIMISNKAGMIRKVYEVDSLL
jgi:hypothetical protein